MVAAPATVHSSSNTARAHSSRNTDAAAAHTNSKYSRMPVAVIAMVFREQLDPLIVDDFVRKHWYNLQPRYYDCDDSYLHTAQYPAVIRCMKQLIADKKLAYLTLTHQQLDEDILNHPTMLLLTHNATLVPAKLRRQDSRVRLRLDVLKLYLYAEMSTKIRVARVELAGHQQLAIQAKRNLTAESPLDQSLFGHLCEKRADTPPVDFSVVHRPYPYLSEPYLNVYHPLHPQYRAAEEAVARDRVTEQHRTMQDVSALIPKEYYLVGPISFCNTACSLCINVLSNHHRADLQPRTKGHEYRTATWTAASLIDRNIYKGHELFLQYKITDDFTCPSCQKLVRSTLSAPTL